MGDYFEYDQQMADDLIAHVVKNQMFMGNPYLYNAPMFVNCHCADGSVGMAVFAGVRNVTDKVPASKLVNLKKLGPANG